MPFTTARRWGIIALLFVAAGINYLQRGSISIALPLISDELSLGPTAKGVLLSAFFWSYASLQIPVGWLLDRWNIRWFYALSFALWTLACAACGLATAFWMLFLFRALLGVGEAIYMPGEQKLVSTLFPPTRRGLPIGLADCGTRVGLALGAPICGFLAIEYGWRAMFYIIGLVPLIWLIPWLAAIPKNFHTAQASAMAEESVTPSAAPAAAAASLQGAALPATAGEARHRKRGITINRNLVGICLGFFCFDYIWYLLVTWMPSFLVDVRHMTVLKAGAYAALPFWVYAAAQPLGGLLGDRLIRAGLDASRVRKGLVTFGLLCGLMVLPVTRVESTTVVIALLSASSLIGIAAANLLVILQTVAPPDEVGSWAGVQNLFGNAAGVVAPIVTGVLISRTGSYLWPFVLAAGLMLPGIISYVFILGRVETSHPVS